jgi:hypothetical protein
MPNVIMPIIIIHIQSVVIVNVIMLSIIMLSVVIVVMVNVFMLSIIMLECHYAECRYGEPCSNMNYFLKKIIHRKFSGVRQYLLYSKDYNYCNKGIVKQVSWFKSSLLLRIQNKHTNKY